MRKEKKLVNNKKIIWLFFIISIVCLLLVGYGIWKLNSNNGESNSSQLSNKNLCASYTKDYENVFGDEGVNCHGNVFYSKYYDSCIAEKYCVSSENQITNYEYQMKDYFNDRVVFICHQSTILGGETYVGTTVFDRELENEMLVDTNYVRNETQCSEVDGIIFEKIK